jgi:hypothetical protein
LIIIFTIRYSKKDCKPTASSLLVNKFVSAGQLTLQPPLVYKEGKYYVSQCLNVDVSSFGESIDDAIASLKEAVSLYFEEHLLPY